MKKIFILLIILCKICLAAPTMEWPDDPCQTLCFVIKDVNNDIWNSSAFTKNPAYNTRGIDAINDTNDYWRYYIYTPDLDAGRYSYYVFSVTAATLSTASNCIGGSDYFWDGNNEITNYSLWADVNALNVVIAREIEFYDSPTRTEATADKDEILADTTILKAGVNVSTIDGEEPLTASEIVADIEAGDSLTGIKAQTDKLTFTGTDVQVTLDGEEVTTDSASRVASKADISALALEVTVQDVNDNIRGDVTALEELVQDVNDNCNIIDSLDFPSGLATNIKQAITQIWAYIFYKTEMSGTQVRTYDVNDILNTTQIRSFDGSTTIVEKAVGE